MSKERIIAVVVLALFGVLFIFNLETSSQVRSYTQKIVNDCASEQNRTSCYEREVPALYPQFSVPELFDIVRGIRVKDPSYQYCHVLAHEIGQRVVAQDPTDWLDAIAQNPKDGLCSNGYIHGVIGGRFRSEVLKDETLQTLIPDFSRACEPREGWSPSLLDEAICYHGMGHLYMFITDAKIQKALSLCEQTAMSPTGDFRRVCREGVFMQIYQALEPDDFLLIEQMTVKPTKDTVRQFCSSFERDAYEGACLRESWPYFRGEITSGSGIERFCSGQPNAEEEVACYESVFSILGRQTLGKPAQALAACDKVSDLRKDLCYSRVALATVEEDHAAGKEAISFCASSPVQFQETCLHSLADTSAFVFGGDLLTRGRFCVQLPAILQSLCRADPRSSQIPQIGFVHVLQ